MNIKEALIDEEGEYTKDFLASVLWLEEKIGKEEDDLQAGWLLQYSLFQSFEDKLGEELYLYCSDKGFNFEMFISYLWHNMELLHAKIKGFSTSPFQEELF